MPQTPKSEEVCISCRKPNAQLACGVCAVSLCRGCAIFLEAGTFSFRETVAPELVHNYYCQGCHESIVEPELAVLEQAMEVARAVFFFFDGRKKPVHVLKKARYPIEVPSCEDRDETILRLGYIASQQGFNAIVDAEVVCKKERNHGFQKMMWSGKGWPAQVDAERLERHLKLEDEG